jgi:hypothetical protein
MLSKELVRVRAIARVGVRVRDMVRDRDRVRVRVERDEVIECSAKNW